MRRLLGTEGLQQTKMANKRRSSRQRGVSIRNHLCSVTVLLLLSCSLVLVSAQNEPQQLQQQELADKQSLPGGLGNLGGGVSNGGGASNGNNEDDEDIEGGPDSNSINSSDNSTLATTETENPLAETATTTENPPPINAETATTTAPTEVEPAATPVAETTASPAPISATVPIPVPAPVEDIAPTTNAPTLPASALDLPHSVDIAECRKHLQVVDINRDNLMSEEEYVKFVQQVVTHDVNHTLANLPSKDIWGNSLSDMPSGVRLLYNNLNQGGVIDIVGYKVNQIPRPTLAQELFLIKVCVHTEIVVHQILMQHQQSGGNIDTSQQVISLPKIEVVTVYSSFSLSNQVGITTAALNSETSHNRKGLELAYQTLITHVVGEEMGVTLAKPTPVTVPTSTAGREATRGRRRLTVALDQQLPEIYRIDDVLCPGASPDASTELQTKWCQVAYGKFLLYLVGEDSVEVYNDYSQAVQNATSYGDLQEILKEVDPGVEVQVTDAGPTILPPAASPPPTPPPHEAPTSSPQNITVDKDATGEGQPEDRETKLGLIFSLAAVLLSVNCCIISVSVYMCYRNRNNRDLDLDDGLEDMDDTYYERRKKKKKSGRHDLSSSFYDDDEAGEMSSSSPPTLQDIAAANAPAPAPYSSQDAQERERILRGQGASSQSDVSSSSASAPTREEIQATLAAASIGGSRPLAPPSETTYEDDENLRVNAGEMTSYCGGSIFRRCGNL